MATVLYGIEYVDSSWVEAIAFVHHADDLGVAISFKGMGGSYCFYRNTDLSDYHKLQNADSKGQAVWADYYGLSYTRIDLDE